MKTKKDKETFLKILKGNGGNINDACNSTNISRRTIYVWIKKEEWFKESVDDIREIGIDNVESALYKNAIEGNTTAQIFYLKTQGKKRGYVEKNELDITSGDEPIKININIEGVEY